MQKLYTYTFYALFLFFPVLVQAQISPNEVQADSTKTVEITLTDNSRQVGQILSVSSTELELQKKMNELLLNCQELDLSVKLILQSVDTTGLKTQMLAGF